MCYISIGYELGKVCNDRRYCTFQVDKLAESLPNPCFGDGSTHVWIAYTCHLISGIAIGTVDAFPRMQRRPSRYIA